MDFSTDIMTILRRGGDPWSKMAPTGRKPRACRREARPAGRPATRLEDPLNEPFDFACNDIGDGAVRAGETMPEPSDYLSEIQRDGKPIGADLVYRETW